MELLDTVVSASALLTFFFTAGGFCIKVFTQRPAEEVLTEWVHSSQPLTQVTSSLASSAASSPQPPTEEEHTIFPLFHPKKTNEQWLEEGDTAARAGHFDEALGAFTAVSQADPQNAVAQRRKGYILNQLRRYDEALEALDEAIRLDPKNVHAYTARGEALKGLNRHPEALAAHNQAIQLEAPAPKAQAGKSITEPPSYGPQADAPQSAASTLPSPDSLQAGVPTPLASPGGSPHQAPPAPWTPPAQPIPPGMRLSLPHPARQTLRWSMRRLIPHPWLLGVSLLAVLVQVFGFSFSSQSTLASILAGFGIYILWGAGIAGAVTAGRGRNWIWLAAILLTIGYALPLFGLFGHPKKKKQRVSLTAGTGEAPMQPALK